MSLTPVSRPTMPTASFPNGIKAERLAAGATILRIHQKDYGPIWFGPNPGDRPANRFDAPPRRITLALYAEYGEVDGLAYRARHDNGQICYTLFDRVRASDVAPGQPALFEDHAAQIEALMQKYGAVFDDSPAVPLV